MYVTLLYPPVTKLMLPIFVKRPKIQGFQSAECLEDFSLSEHQNIRKAVLCVLPKEFCVRRSEKRPNDSHLRTQSEEYSSESCKLEACKQAKIVLCVLSSACRLSLQISPKIQGFHLSFFSSIRRDEEETAWKLFEDGGTSPTLLSLLLTIAMVRLYLAAKSPRV